MVKKAPREASMSLYEEIVKLKDLDSCYRFFQDLCSINELRSMEQRFDVARLLQEGKVYTEIVEETGALLDLAERIIDNPTAYQDVCRHKKLATLFYEPSTRTRLSFEAAMLNLGKGRGPINHGFAINVGKCR